MSDRNVYVYTSGLVSCSACAPADMPIDEVAREVNLQNPTGISSRWQAATEPFADGTPNPCPCNQHPVERVHYLFNC